MSLRIYHSADWHVRPQFWKEAQASLHVMRNHAAANGCDLFVFPGDLAHGAMQDSERDVLDGLAAELQAFAEIAPVAIVYGYRHDVRGSLEVFERLSSLYPIRILRPGRAYYLVEGGGITKNLDRLTTASDKALLFGIPEPTKEWLLTGASGAMGKDDSDQVVRDLLRAHLLGLAAIRRQHSDLPCVLLYHGDVYGATTATGHSTEAGTELAVARDDLAAIGFDYGAFGHIHLPQQVKGLPAYYPGKLYTGDWGERGYVPGCNIATLSDLGPLDPAFPNAPNGFVAQVERLSFPHPERIKIESTVPYQDKSSDYKGKLLWLELTCTKEEAEKIVTEGTLAALRAGGALEGSQVTLSVLPTETVRAAEIVNKTALRDKAEVWAKASDLTLPLTVLSKADELEREVGSLQDRAGHPRRFRNLSTRLRGSKGFWRRQRKDEVFIDWQDLGEGVVAYIGPNGNGKTTSFDFSKPWPAPTSRRPKTLSKHFRLRDSAIENVYLEELSGFRYRVLINIDGATKSGGAEHFLFRDDGTGEKPVEGVTGKQDQFFEAIDAIFGSMDIYMRTAYVAQRATKDFPDIADATQEEKKALIAELAGKDYAPYQATAKAHGDTLERALVPLDAAITAGADVDEVLARLQSEKSEAEEKARNAEADAETAQGNQEKLRLDRQEVAARVAELDRQIARRAQLVTEIHAAEASLDAIAKEIGGFTQAADGRAAAEAELARLDGLVLRIHELQTKKAEHDQAYRTELEDFQTETEGSRLHGQTLQRELDAARKAHAEAVQEAAVARAKLTAPIADTCPTCGQSLPADRLQSLRHAHEEATDALARLEIAEEATETAKAKAELAREENVREFSERRKPEPVEFEGQAGLAKLSGDFAFADSAGATETVAKAKEAAIRIEEGTKRLVEGQKRKAIAEGEVTMMDARPEDRSREALAQLDEQLAQASLLLTEATAAKAAALATAEAASRSIAEAEKRKADRCLAKMKRDETAAGLADWRALERAIEGVRDLELDALAPSIAEIATRLLNSAGEPGRIEIETTRISSGSAKKAKQIEDFLIFYAAEDGERQDIGTCSGGEMVWQRKALYDAFAVIRAKNAGIRFTTAMLDETDGALHPARKQDYFHMLEAAHKESDRYQTVLITQSSELAAMAASVLDVTSLGPKPEGAKAEGEAA